MKGRLLIAGALVIAAALVVGIAASLPGGQSGSDTDIPELRAGPRIPAGVSTGEPEVVAAEAPQVQGVEPATDAEAPALSTTPDVGVGAEAEALVRPDAPAANEPINVQPVQERVV